MIEAEKFVEHRKSSLIELRDLIFKRDTLNREIRAVRKDLNGWDVALINE